MNLDGRIDRAYCKKDDTRIDEIWVVISAVGYWLNNNQTISEVVIQYMLLLDVLE